MTPGRAIAALLHVQGVWHGVMRWLGLAEPLSPCARWRRDIRSATCPDCGWPRTYHGGRP